MQPLVLVYASGNGKWEIVGDRNRLSRAEQRIHCYFPFPIPELLDVRHHRISEEEHGFLVVHVDLDDEVLGAGLAQTLVVGDRTVDRGGRQEITAMVAGAS